MKFLIAFLDLLEEVPQRGQGNRLINLAALVDSGNLSSSGSDLD